MIQFTLRTLGHDPVFSQVVIYTDSWQSSWSSGSIGGKMFILDKLKQLSTESPLSSPKEGGGSEESSGGSAAASGTPATVSKLSPDAKENVSPSVFNPSSNLFTMAIGAEILDKPQPNAPTE